MSKRDLDHYDETVECPKCGNTVYINHAYPCSWHDKGINCDWNPF